MITKQILGEKILRKINGGDYTLSSSSVKPQDVYLEIEAARNTLIQKWLNESKEDISSQFETTYLNVKVTKDTSRNRFFSILPAQLISLVIKGNSSNSIGIRQISGMKDEYNVFIPMNSNDTAVFSGLEASSLGGKIGFWSEGNKVFYENMPDFWNNEAVLIKMISSIFSLADDAFIPIPAGEELALEDLVYERMLKFDITPEAKLADANSNTK